MSDPSGLMLKPHQRATALRLLIVADQISDAAPIANALAAAHMTFRSEVAATEGAYRSLLQDNLFDAVLVNESPQAPIAPLVALQLLGQSGQKIPVIAIAPAWDDERVSRYRQLGIADCVARERIFTLPEILERSLLPANSKLSAPLKLLPSPLPKKASTTANRIIQQMWEYPDLERRLHRAANRLHESLGIDRCLIFLPDGEQKMKVRYTSKATTEKDRFLGSVCQASERYYNLLSQGIPVVFSCVDEQSPTVVQKMAALWEFRAVAAVPILYQQSYLGMLGLQYCDREHEWTEAELTLARTVAGQCALALHQSRLERQCYQQQQWTQLLHRLSQILNRDRDTETKLQQMVDCIGKGFEGERVFLLRLERDTEMLETSSEWRANSELPSLSGVRVPLGEWQRLLNSNEDYQTCRYFQAVKFPQCCWDKPAMCKILEDGQARSLLSLPIFLRGELVGFLNLQTCSQSRSFSAEEISILSSATNSLAIALEAARQDNYLEREIAERTQQLEAAKKRSDAENQAKSELLSTMSHELRTPLTSIIGFSRMLIDRCYGDLNDKQQQYVSAIASSGEHLLSLINDLLDISKIEANKEELYVEILSVEEICLASLSILQERAKQAGLALNLDIHGDVAVCAADRRRLKQILVNLLSNAVKFTEEGSISLKVEPQGRMLAFSVIDTGIGMSPENLKHLFQPFHQIKTHLHRKHKGTGLGLALSRKLARLHKGDLTVTSQEGKGTCFTLHLPRTDSASDCS